MPPFSYSHMKTDVTASGQQTRTSPTNEHEAELVVSYLEWPKGGREGEGVINEWEEGSKHEAGRTQKL